MKKKYIIVILFVLCTAIGCSDISIMHKTLETDITETLIIDENMFNFNQLEFIYDDGEYIYEQ